jgi:Tol biopolymer transport system component
MPDGKALVISVSDRSFPVLALAPLDGSKPRPLTANAEGSGGDTTPAVSPDGATVAFVRANSSTDGSDIFLCDLSGGSPRRVTFDDRPIRGLAWTPDGRDLVYGGNRMRGWRLWRLPAFGGSPRELIIAGGRAQYPAVASTGNRLVYSDSTEVSAIWRADLTATKSSDAKSSEAKTTEDRPLLRSLGREWWPMYSPDGKKIADFASENDSDQLWVSDADGKNRVQVTHMTGARMGRLRWSPDSKTLLFDVSLGGPPDLYTIPASGGKSNRVIAGGSNASWSNDGKRIYYNLNGQIWKASPDGANPEVLVSQPGAAQPVESPDGKFVYYRMRRSFWRIPAAGGEAEEAIFPDHGLMWSTTLQMSKKGLYYLEFERSDRNFVLTQYDFAAKNNSLVFRFKNMDWGTPSFSVSPDGKWVLYPRVDQSQTDLMLVENFR